MKTVNKKYEIPLKNNDVLNDLSNLNVTLSKIDEDITVLEEAEKAFSIDVENSGLKTVKVPSNINLKTEISDLKKGCYLVLNDSGDEFQTVEGGGNSGGKTNQVLSKNSDENFDTSWNDLYEISANSLINFSQIDDIEGRSNSSNILSVSQEEISTNNILNDHQTKASEKLEVGDAYVLTSRVEGFEQQVGERKATEFNPGIVKIGRGVDVSGGSISVVGGGDATKTEFGTVQPGDRFSVDLTGKLDFLGYPKASKAQHGTVKLSDDFGFGKDGDLQMIITGDPIVYDLAIEKAIIGDEISVEKNIGMYKKTIQENTDFSINLNNFTPTQDMSILVEITATDLLKISFDNVDEKIDILKGVALFKLIKKLGSEKWDVELISASGAVPVLLTPNVKLSITEDFYFWSAAIADMEPYDRLNAEASSYFGWVGDPREVFFSFASPVLVESLYFYDTIENPETPVTLYASNDNNSWDIILNKYGTLSEYYLKTTAQKTYKYYKLSFRTGREIRGIALYGYVANPAEGRFVRVTPIMSATTQDGVTISGSSGVNLDFTKSTNNNGKDLKPDASQSCWLQYEFEEPQVVNILEMASEDYYSDWTINEYDQAIYASNDGENWIKLRDTFGVVEDRNKLTRIYEFENSIAYKYYKWVCYANRTVSVARCILHRRETF